MAPPSEPPLRNLKVLIDAFNTDLPEGSGVATYSRTLCATLAEIGASVAWLHSRDTPADPDPLIREVAFHGGQLPRIGRLGRVIRELRFLVGAFGPFGLTATTVPRQRAVILPARRSLTGASFNVPNLTEIAMLRHRMLDRFVKVRVPDSFHVAHLTYPWPIEFSDMRTVTTIHDVIPLRLPYTTLDDKREIVKRLRTAGAKADLVLTVSEASKRDIVEFLGIKPDKVAVTYQSSDLAPLSEDEKPLTEGVLTRLQLRPDGYALFVGAIEPKKNVKRLVSAYFETGRKEPLVIVGRRAWLWEQELAQALAARRGRVILLDYVSEDDLRHLYAGARCLLFPSLYEGFGLPCLEAMRLGAPVLTSNVASLPEVCGDAAVYVDPMDTRDMRSKIAALMSDEKLRQELSEKGKTQAARFTQERYAAALTDAYARVLR